PKVCTARNRFPSTVRSPRIRWVPFSPPLVLILPAASALALSFTLVTASAPSGFLSPLVVAVFEPVESRLLPLQPGNTIRSNTSKHSMQRMIFTPLLDAGAATGSSPHFFPCDMASQRLYSSAVRPRLG